MGCLLTMIIFLLMGACLLVNFTAATQISSRAAYKLDEIVVSRHHMKGEYCSLDREKGIHFQVESSNSTKYITITNFSGVDIFSSYLIDPSTTFMSVMSRYYLVTRTQSKGKTIVRNYLVPRIWKKLVLKALRMGIPSIQLSGYLDANNVKKTSSSDFSKLALSKEAELIQDAAMELGRRGLKGEDSTAAMAFYVLAIRLAKFQPMTKDDSCGRAGYMSKELLKEQYFKTGRLTNNLCKNNGEYCNVCPKGNKCAGQCGLGCQCWSMVCGDCCYHHGCFMHDRCCKDGLSFSCLNVFGFKCDSEFTC